MQVPTVTPIVPALPGRSACARRLAHSPRRRDPGARSRALATEHGQGRPPPRPPHGAANPSLSIIYIARRRSEIQRFPVDTSRLGATQCRVSMPLPNTGSWRTTTTLRGQHRQTCAQCSDRRAGASRRASPPPSSLKDTDPTGSRRPDRHAIRGRRRSDRSMASSGVPGVAAPDQRQGNRPRKANAVPLSVSRSPTITKSQREG